MPIASRSQLDVGRVSRYQEFRAPGRNQERGRPVVRTAKTIVEEVPYAEDEYDDSVSSEEIDEGVGAAVPEGHRAVQEGAQGGQ